MSVPLKLSHKTSSRVSPAKTEAHTTIHGTCDDACNVSHATQETSCQTLLLNRSLYIDLLLATVTGLCFTLAFLALT